MTWTPVLGRRQPQPAVTLTNSILVAQKAVLKALLTKNSSVHQNDHEYITNIWHTTTFAYVS